MIRRDSPSRAVALDLMLRTFMNSSDFNNMQSKNWEAIAKLIPGTTPQECAKRFNELQSAAGDLSPVGDFTGLAAQGKPAPRGRPGSATSKYQQQPPVTSTSEEKHDEQRHGRKDVVQEFVNNNSNQDDTSDKKRHETDIHTKKIGPDSYGPNMVIHVCDEAKNVKKDFTCPRDLLVTEMRYFAEYLSSETQRWEEVDISVHCDVQIFDWLMSYVKRNCPGSQTRLSPNLEASNVISILISSDFLKMDSLVSECIDFCHKNMSAIVATPCNMNCINDNLCTRIAFLFSDLEVDKIKDRKDKFKSKLFCKKIEGMFEATKPAATLYRCQHCKHLMTKDLRQQLKCLPTRMSIDRHGDVVYHHQRDPSWDINDYLLAIHSELKSWREVYWRLWATVNSLQCSRCKQVFPCSELGHCRFHPEPAKFDNSVASATTATGMYGCCKQTTLRFDPLNQNTGCQVRDHIVMIPTLKESIEVSRASNHQVKGGRADDAQILDILLERKDFMCIPPTSLEQERWHDINIFRNEEALCGLADDGIGVKGQLQNIFPDDHLPLGNQADGRHRDDDSSLDLDSSDDEVGDEELDAVSFKHRQKYLVRKMSSKSSVGKEKQNSQNAVDSASSNIGYRRTKWDPQRSLRFNQDNQREEDHKRNQLMVNHLAKLRTNTGERLEKTKVKEYSGGLFSRLEVQFKASCQISKPATTQVTLQRAKTRANQLRTT